uniref:coiled-coil domain-containing protein 170-like isoform X2 n=1 Tax=Ictidomys tridecemlineatus TaxID=43179 RepID=UPI001A9EF0BF|nr:coiled-coil domain-containing protein 170-like isoform X2 [Ictidomys tridecemlineatus]
MSSPLRSLNHSHPGRLPTRPHEAKSPQVKQLSAWKNHPVACFDLPPEVISTRNPVTCKKRAADPVHPDFAGLLVKNKNLLAELRNLQSKLLIKESMLQEMKSELESYKENNTQQSFQIMSLRDDIQDLQELIASLTRIKSLKNTNIESLERGNWELTERVTALEKLLKVHLVEREKAERKADLLEKMLSGTSRFPSYMTMKGQEDLLDVFPVKDKTEAFLANNFERDIFHTEEPNHKQKIWDGCQQDLIQEDKQAPELDRQPYSCGWETETAQSQYQNFLSQLSTLLSDSIVPIPATEEAVKERILEISENELSWKSENFRTPDSQVDKHNKKFKQLEMLLNIRQNLQIITTPILEEKIQKLQKQLSDLKLSNKNMKTQLTKINVLKDKTIMKLRQSLTKVETMKEKVVMNIDDLKTTSDSAEQEARPDKEKARQMLDTVTPELSIAKNVLEVSGQEQELGDFRETILKMLGFDMKTADKEIINQLKLIIQVYEISNKSKIASDCETGQDNE